MAESRLRLRGTIWAPKALVVISCALALLAVQPSMAAPVSRNRPIVFREAGHAPSATNLDLSRTSSATTPRAVSRIAPPTKNFFGDAQQLHILATVEILQRLLWSHLQPAQPQYFTSLWLWPECPALTVIPPATSSPMSRKPILNRPLPEVEKAYTMAHCQLAPPLA